MNIVTSAQAAALGLGRIAGLEKHIRQYRNGRDSTQTSREAMVIDLFGLGVEEVRTRFSAVYQHLLEQVKPERDQNNCAGRREKWWLFGEALSTFRPALEGLQRYIATVETAKHRIFQFLSTDILPDNMLVNIALEDGYSLGILSSRVHVVWALAAGGRLGVGNDPRHNKSRCFEPFPFPMPIEQQRKGISELAEQIDAHRKRQLALHPSLTLTEMYNTLETLRVRRVLTDKEKQIDTLGLVSTLLELHQKLDALVLLTYGWAGTLSDADNLEKLVALNLERQSKEAKGTVRYLRPAYQNPSVAMHDTALELPDDEDALVVPLEIVAFPKTLGEQSQAIRNALKTSVPLTAKEVAGRSKGAKCYRHINKVLTRAFKRFGLRSMLPATAPRNRCNWCWNVQLTVQ